MVRLIESLFFGLIILTATNAIDYPPSVDFMQDVTGEKWQLKCAFYIANTLEIDKDLNVALAACGTVGRCMNTASTENADRSEKFVKDTVDCLDRMCKRLNQEIIKKSGKEYNSEVCYMVKAMLIMIKALK
ncbi:uncharacterized protein LOC123297778 [Chrysoperla carnea]|uniref:uncharacterized protein LOC123297778 n=1 Tax=Chrysoperla carnea TaxID=189513 RepID=UPI001D098EF7|nr:uncharacterized protein LOC123297778 [Chrysoperla carnea]